MHLSQYVHNVFQTCFVIFDNVLFFFFKEHAKCNYVFLVWFPYRRPCFHRFYSKYYWFIIEIEKSNFLCPHLIMEGTNRFALVRGSHSLLTDWQNSGIWGCLCRMDTFLVSDKFTSVFTEESKTNNKCFFKDNRSIWNEGRLSKS
jgi:hypothetical protein